MSLLRTERLRKYFGDTRAVDDVDFTVREGEFLSLVGTNGAGKTTLVNLISAFLFPDSGRIFIGERDITYAPVDERIRAGIARSFQLVNLFDDLSVLDNVALAIFARQGKTSRVLVPAERDAGVTAEALDLLGQFGLGGKAQGLAGGLAQGERKLLDVAVAYALRPRLLFLDEPTSGVSTRDKAQIMDTVSSVVRGGKITAVVIEHDMDVVFKYSDRVVVMHEGRFLADGPPEEIRQNRDVATYLLGTDVSD
jgi:branched-chain amino acid transport system ATP-binding protein